MNSDELKQIFGIIVAVGSPYAAQIGLTPGAFQDAVTAIGTLIGVGYLIYQHWNQKKVPESATVIPPTK